MAKPGDCRDARLGAVAVMDGGRVAGQQAGMADRVAGMKGAWCDRVAFSWR